MADYIRINHYDRGGELAISRKVFARLAKEAVEHSSVKTSVKVNEPVHVIFKKDGQVKIRINIDVKKGEKPTDICLEIQKEIAKTLEVYVESVPFEIEISVDQIK